MMWKNLKRLWRYDPLRRLLYWMQAPSDADRLADALRRVGRHGLRLSFYERQDGDVDVRVLDIDGLTVTYFVERVETDPVRRAARAIEGALERVGL